MKRIFLLLIAILAISATSATAFAGTGSIRLDPHSSTYPQSIMLSSPATFNVTVQGADGAFDPHILLVMTNASYQGLSGNVTVNWTGGQISIAPGDFIEPVGTKIPPGATNGAAYTVSSLRDHIGVSGASDNSLWYTFKSILSGPLSKSGNLFTVTITSTATRMLVYVLGKSSEAATEFDMKVPNTQPGLVVPEPMPVLITIGSFAALALYAIKRKKD
jgi:hypothetical protein